MNFCLRPIAHGDWSAIDRIQRACFPPSAHESIPALRSLAELSASTCGVAVAGTEVVGYFLAHPWRADDLPPLGEEIPSLPARASSLFIHDLAVHPSARGGGVAQSLVESTLAAARALGLAKGSLLSVQDSDRFWSRYGFRRRPELTARFTPAVTRYYALGFEFMTAELDPGR